MQDIDESPWDDSPSGGTHAAEAEWTRLSTGFQNVSPPLTLPPFSAPILKNESQAGYREGITAGKESALQEGFDTGFAQTGGPLGRELGLLRGVANTLLHHLSRTRTQQHDDEKSHVVETSKQNASLREIIDALAAVRFADLAPPPPSSHVHDEEAEAGGHSAHCVESGRGDGGGEETSPSSSDFGSVAAIEDVRALRVKLETLLRESGLEIDLNLEIF